MDDAEREQLRALGNAQAAMAAQRLAQTGETLTELRQDLVSHGIDPEQLRIFERAFRSMASLSLASTAFLQSLG